MSKQKQKTPGERLKAWRLSEKLNMREAGERFGINDSGYSKWEKGRVSQAKCLKVSEVTGIPLHELRPDIYPAPKGEAISGKK